jgi:hypothetical protein
MAGRASQAHTASNRIERLAVKAGIVDLTGDDRAIILGALLWMADRLKSNQGERARALWAAKGKEVSLWNER